MNLFESLNCEGLCCSQESSSRPGRMSKCWFSKISTSRRLLAKQEVSFCLVLSGTVTMKLCHEMIIR